MRPRLTLLEFGAAAMLVAAAPYCHTAYLTIIGIAKRCPSHSLRLRAKTELGQKILASLSAAFGPDRMAGRLVALIVALR